MTAVNPTVCLVSVDVKETGMLMDHILSFRIVGRKTGKDAKLTLQEKYMN